MNRHVILLPLLLLAACARMGGNALEQATSSLASGELGAAEVHLLSALKRDPDSGEANLLLARVQFLRGEPDASSASIEKAMALGADAGAAALLRGTLLLEKGRYEELINWLGSGNTAVGTDDAAILRGRAFLGAARYPEALAQFQQVPADSALRAEADVYAAQTHLALHRWSRARESLDRARAADPSLPQAWLQTGILALQERQFDKARKAFLRAEGTARDQLTQAERSLALSTAASLALDGGDMDAAKGAYELLSRILPGAPQTELLGADISLATGDTNAAVSRLERLVRDRPELPAARTALAGALILAGLTGRAAQELGQVGTLSPGTSAAKKALVAALDASEPARTLSLAQALIALRMPRSAQEVLKRGITATDGSLALKVASAQLLMARGQLEEARQLSDELVMRDPDDVPALTVQAQVHAAVEDLVGAANSYERIWRLAPSEGAAINLALARHEAGKNDSILPLTVWLAHAPGDIGARLVLAELQARTGRAKEAISGFQAVLKEYPRHAAALNQLALLYQRQGDPLALETARAAHEAAPERAEMTDTYAWILVENGHPAEAVPILERVIRKGVVDAAVRYHYSVSLIRRDGPGDAETGRLWLEDLLNEEFSERTEVERLLEGR